MPISKEDIGKVLLKNTSISPLWNATSKPSFVWKHFGTMKVLYNEKIVAYDDKKVCCTACLDSCKSRSKLDKDLLTT